MFNIQVSLVSFITQRLKTPYKKLSPANLDMIAVANKAC